MLQAEAMAMGGEGMHGGKPASRPTRSKGLVPGVEGGQQLAQADLPAVLRLQRAHARPRALQVGAQQPPAPQPPGGCHAARRQVRQLRICAANNGMPARKGNPSSIPFFDTPKHVTWHAVLLACALLELTSVCWAC